MEKTELVSFEGHKVRVLINDEAIFFSATDILSVCGLAYPIKKIQSLRIRFPEYFVKKIYPEDKYNTMWFVELNYLNDLLDSVSCSSYSRNWFIKYIFDDYGSASTSSSENEHKTTNNSYIIKKIDSIVNELLELKEMLK